MTSFSHKAKRPSVEAATAWHRGARRNKIKRMIPETKYAKSGSVNVAYQVIGDAPLDLVLVPGWMSNLDCFWEEPSLERFLRRLASFSRLILFDKRGTGLSDRVTESPTLEERMDDVRAVMDAVGSVRAALLGYSEGGPMCVLFAATYPERTESVVMIGSYARRFRAPDYPWGPTPEEHEAYYDTIQREWGGPFGLEARAPSVAQDERFRQWWARLLRMSASPSTAESLARMNAQIDIRHVLPAIRVPTLILHLKGDRVLDPGGSRYMAERILGAKYIELPGIDHLPWVGSPDTILDEVEDFFTGVRRGPEPDRVLSTVMFSDIVGSTQRAAELGDRRWRELLESHRVVVRRELARFRGREVEAVGDGFLVTFDGPARAIQCACGISDAVRQLGLAIRVGLHTGECELKGDSLGGIALHIGARVAANAGPNEVLVSSTVKDLVAGSGICFDDAGTHVLKGVPGEWRLFAVKRPEASYS